MNEFRRTRFSVWVYRITLALMVLTTLRFAQFGWAFSSEQMASSDNYQQFLAQIATLKQPLGLFMATVAFALRSSASYWLVGYLVLDMGAGLLLPLVWGNVAGPGTLFVAGTIATLVISIVGLFYYLIRHDEVRAI